MSSLVIASAAAIATSVPVALWAVGSARPVSRRSGRSLLTQRIDELDFRQHELARPASQRLRPITSRAGALIRRVTPAGLVDALERRIIRAGRPAIWTIERILIAKVVLAVAMFATGWAALAITASPARLFGWIAVCLGAYMLPDLALHQRAAARAAEIDARLPDTLDQLTIAVEAGLGFDAAMAHVARSGRGPLAEELRRTMQEIQLGEERMSALRNFADRVDAPNVRHFVTGVVQAEQYGIPVGEILRTQADEQRVRRRQRAEEQATKMPVKLVFPLVLCILPTLFIVILGPAVLQISATLLSSR